MSEQQPAGGPRALRVFALVAVCVGVAALAAAAFIFSYTGIHVVVLQAGVNSRLAKGYPLILDVLLVVILAAMLALRGAGWPSKLVAWVSLIALLAAAAGADALHAAGDRLPKRTAEITVAVLPWALVLIAFVLLLAMLRQAKVRRQAHAGEQVRPPKWQPPQPPPLSRQALVPGFPATETPTAPLSAARTETADTETAGTDTAPVPVAAAPDALAAQPPAAETHPTPAQPDKPNDTWRLAVPRQVTPETVDGTVAEPAMAANAPDGALDAELMPDDPASAAEPEDDHFQPGEDPAAMASSEEPEADQDAADTADSDTAEPDTAESDTGDPESADPETGDPETGEADSDEDVQTADMEMPVFHRMWSSPVPPSEDAD